MVNTFYRQLNDITNLIFSNFLQNVVLCFVNHIVYLARNVFSVFLPHPFKYFVVIPNLHILLFERN